jgi:hypothetical protein
MMAMMRASWKGALLAVAASAGVAWGQSAGDTVTLHQKDGLPEPCSVLKTWKTADGRSAALLQSLDTDELLTVVRKRGGKGESQVGVGIFRWGNATVPPEGSPAPPPDSGVRQASFKTEAPPHRLGDLPQMVQAACAELVPAAVAHPASCATGSCDKTHCTAVHHFEKPAPVRFVPGDCLPVCAPLHAPDYGYHPTQWRPFPAAQQQP